MKRNLLISLLMVGALIALNSCKKEYLVEVKGTVNGNVREYFTSQALQGVLVRLIVNDQTTLKDSTDASGYYSISGIPAGYYWIIFSKAGYATVRSQVTIESPSEVSNTTSGKKQSYIYGDIQDAYLAQNTGKVNGLVTFNGAPISGATVVANVTNYFAASTSDLEPALYSTTTDANGAYSFTNLPVGCDVTFAAYSGSASGASSSNTLGMGQTITPLHVATFSISEMSLYLLSYTGESDAKIDTTTSSIVLTFSENINEAITKANNDNGGVWITAVTSGGARLLTTATFSNNTITLTLPAGTLARGTTYYIHYNVHATEVKTASDVVSFETKDKGATIAATAASLAYTDPNLVVTNLPAITGMPTGTVLNFDVYFRAFGDDLLDYRIITSGISITGSTTQRTIASSGGFTPGYYYVVPKVTGLDGVTVYGVPSTVATRPAP